jgi:predicted GNAT family acetyltransferase
MELNDIALKNNEALHSFEIFVEGHRSFIDYKQKGDNIYLLHTEVPANLRGKGIANVLVEKTFVYLEENQLKLVPLCRFVKAYLTRNPTWNRLLAHQL